MEEEKQEKEKLDLNETCEVIENKLKELTDDGYRQENSKYWGDTIDIYKDIYEIKAKKEELKMYRGNYERYNDGYSDNYNEGALGARGYPGTGVYRDGGNYSRRYRGDDIMADMQEEYGRYMGEHEYGRYGSPEEDKSFKYMIKAYKDFAKHIAKEATSPEQKEMIKQAAREVMEDV